MSRLIDADKLDSYIKDKLGGYKAEYELFATMIDNQPTAYDVEKVVEQIEERKTDNIRISKLQDNSHTKKISHICRSDEDEHVIRLVKGAVKDE